MIQIIDPRKGDAEDDASSPKRRTLLSLAGSLVAEISLPKLVLAWVLLIGLPGFLLPALAQPCGHDVTLATDYDELKIMFDINLCPT